MPVVIPYEDIYFRDHWDAVTGCPWWYLHETDVEREVEWRRNAAAAIGQDWFYLPFSYTKRQRDELRIEHDGGKAWRVNRRTGVRDPLQRRLPGGWLADGQVQSAHPASIPMNRAAVERCFPPPCETDIEAFGGLDAAEAILHDFGRNLMPIQHIASPFWNCYGLWGFETMMTLVADRPDLVAYACSRILPHRLHQARCTAALGAKVVWIEECMTDMISPAAFEQLNVPFVARLVEEIRRQGMKSVYYYCGNPDGKWDHILAIGADAIALEESKKGFTISVGDTIRRVRGRAVVFGNLDAMYVLERGTGEDLHQAIHEQKQAAVQAQKRFVMSLGSPVTAITTPDRVRQYIRMAR